VRTIPPDTADLRASALYARHGTTPSAGDHLCPSVTDLLPERDASVQSHPPRMTATAQPLADTGERELP
jgi:hypothetical protein